MRLCWRLDLTSRDRGHGAGNPDRGDPTVALPRQRLNRARTPHRDALSDRQSKIAIADLGPGRQCADEGGAGTSGRRVLLDAERRAEHPRMKCASVFEAAGE